MQHFEYICLFFLLNCILNVCIYFIIILHYAIIYHRQDPTATHERPIPLHQHKQAANDQAKIWSTMVGNRRNGQGGQR